MTTTTQSNEKAAPVVLPVDLRDYFAAKAMQGLCANPGGGFVTCDADDVATTAYHMADAMLKAREA